MQKWNFLGPEELRRSSPNALGNGQYICAYRRRFSTTSAQRELTNILRSIDIDVLDPAQAPGTGTPESGGWTTREMRILLQSLSDLNIVGADVVEVAPAYDVGGKP